MEEPTPKQVFRAVKEWLDASNDECATSPATRAGYTREDHNKSEEDQCPCPSRWAAIAAAAAVAGASDSQRVFPLDGGAKDKVHA